MYCLSLTRPISCFFFSSRRRHTRCYRDWSSDVCSSDLCRHVFADMVTLPCAGFDDAMAAVRDGQAELAMLPVENSVAGRVADIHHLLPDSGLQIVGEHFERVEHQLLA